MKAQSALEYLMIIAITLTIIVPTIYLFYAYSKQSTEQIAYSQIDEIGKSIVNNAESVYYSGEYSKIVMDVNMPDHINDVYILYNKELVFDIETELGSIEMVFFSNVKIVSDSCVEEKCSLSSIASYGLKKIKVESITQGQEILITELE